jgi:hypothetical protein
MGPAAFKILAALLAFVSLPGEVVHVLISAYRYLGINHCIGLVSHLVNFLSELVNDCLLLDLILLSFKFQSFQVVFQF